MTYTTAHPAMDSTLATPLPTLLPLAVDWAERENLNILTHGKPLAFWQKAEARRMGVREPAKVRILAVDVMPRPENSYLLAATRATGLIGPETLGLTLGYGILIVRSSIGRRQILRHELRHVAHYEAAGSVAGFIAEYLDQIARHGYWDAPLEVDARRYAQG